MTTYNVAPDETADQLQAIIKRYRGDLEHNGVEIQILTAHAKRDAFGNPKGPALKLGNNPNYVAR